MITFKNISFQLQEKIILSHLELTIPRSQTVILLGKNGSGKSSLLKLLDRRYPLQQGTLTIDGKPLQHYSAKQLARTMATLTQQPLDSLFSHLTVKENCLLAARQARSFKKESELKNYLAEFNPKLPLHLDTLCQHLSGGEQQALMLALACLSQPKIILLDEHTSALDPKAAEELIRLTQEKINAYNLTAIICTHNLDHALRYGHRLIALQEGKIIRDYCGPEKEKLTLEKIRQECYGDF